MKILFRLNSVEIKFIDMWSNVIEIMRHVSQLEVSS